MTASYFFFISLVLILAYDAWLWFRGKETITQWHMSKVKDIPWEGRAILFGWGALVGHLFL